ncbi:MAG: hypothetical protein IJT66_06465 [Clostridia bacterium]|nr:hypothetical protein [Clostridia bacterium]
MDDLSATLSQILGDPKKMEQLRQAAGMLFGSSEGTPSPDPAPGFPSAQTTGEPPAAPLSGGLPEWLGGMDLGALASVLSRVRNTDDDRVRLLMALRPHLSERRRARADTAIKLLKIIDLLPLLKDSGLLSL